MLVPFKRLLILVLSVALANCHSLESHHTAKPLPYTAKKSVKRQIIGQSNEFVILRAGTGDSLEHLAAYYLKDKNKAWMIAEFNQIRNVHNGQEVIIPLQPVNPLNIDIDGFQTVPILCYHRFGGGEDRMSVSVSSLRAQMEYLKNHNYHVIPLKDLLAFFEGRKQLPKKSVVITIDDGFRSIYDIAYPIFKEFQYPVTVFVYTDFIGAPAALSWEQIRKMQASNLVDFQSHSKSHANLGLKKVKEPPQDYAERIHREIVEPHHVLSRKLNKTLNVFAYPYGDTTDQAIGILQNLNYQIGVTVQPGGNPAFAYPYMLQRSMIYGDHDLTAFAARLETYRRIKP